MIPKTELIKQLKTVLKIMSSGRIQEAKDLLEKIISEAEWR
jgi:hypothetical protein